MRGKRWVKPGVRKKADSIKQSGEERQDKKKVRGRDGTRESGGER